MTESSEPLVSIVILNYNAGKLLLECVESIYQSQNNNFEVILVDNASTDKTYRECIEKFPDIKLILTGGGLKKKYPWLINKNIVPKEELYNLIFNSICMCVPLQFGSGTRVKIIEALSLGSIVVSSKKGIEGIELLNKNPPYVFNNTNNTHELQVIYSNILLCINYISNQYLVEEIFNYHIEFNKY